MIFVILSFLLSTALCNSEPQKQLDLESQQQLDQTSVFEVKRHLSKKAEQSLSQGAKLLNPIRYTIEPFQHEIPPACTNAELSSILNKNGLVHGYHHATKYFDLNRQFFGHKIDFINIKIDRPSHIEISAIMKEMVFFVDLRGRLEAISFSTGLLGDEDKYYDWSQRIIPGEVMAYGISRYRKKLFCATAFGDLMMLDAITGDSLGQIKLPCGSDCPPLLHNNLIYLVLYDGSLVAINNERILWKNKSDTNVTAAIGSHKCIPYGDTIIYNAGDKMIAADAKLGRIMWQQHISNCPKALFHQKTDIKYWTINTCRCDQHKECETTIYAADSIGNIVAMRAYDGQIIWTKDSINLLDQMIIGGNTIFIVTTDNIVMALENHSGKIGWAKQFNKDITGMVLTSSGLAVATKNGVIHFLDPKSGEIINELNLCVDIISRPLVANNALYVITKNNQVCCYDSNPSKMKAKFAGLKFQFTEE